MKKWHEQLKHERISRGWTQRLLAEKIGANKFTITRWENGAAFPNRLYREKLATLLGINFEEKESVPTSAEFNHNPPEQSAFTSRSMPTFQSLHRLSWHPLLLGSMILLVILLIVAGLPTFTRLPLLREKEKQVSPSPSNIHAQGTYGPPSYTLTIQNTDPSLNKTTQQLQNVFKAVYAQLVNRFALDPASAVNNSVTLTFSSDLTSAAQTSGRTITINPHWMELHPTQVGLLTHELTLVVEHYPSGAPAWFADGMADYARSVYGPADDDWSLPDSVQPHQSYRQGGGITARFLRWVELHTRLDSVDQLHHALQRGLSFSIALRYLSNETVDDLWSQYQAQPDITPTPQQRYTIATSRKPLYQSSFYLQTTVEGDTQGLYLSNFVMQADISIVIGNDAGFFFRTNDTRTNWYSIYLFPSEEEYCLDYKLQEGPFTFNPLIKAGQYQTNRLTIIVEKSSIYVYINGQFVTGVDDNRLASYGILGVMTNHAGSPFDVRFEKVQVF